MAGRWTGPRITRRLTPEGVAAVVSKNHGPPGGEPAEDVHGDRGATGRGSAEALKAVLTAMRSAGMAVPVSGIRDGDDVSLWDAASQQYGSFDAVRDMLNGLPPRQQGQALRAGDVPRSAFPDAAKVAAARAELADTKCAWCGTAASVKLHGKAGEDGRGACRQHERAVGDALRGEDPTVSREPIRR
jgi:hypothetical protein